MHVITGDGFKVIVVLLEKYILKKKVVHFLSLNVFCYANLTMYGLYHFNISACFMVGVDLNLQ